MSCFSFASTARYSRNARCCSLCVSSSAVVSGTGLMNGLNAVPVAAPMSCLRGVVCMELFAVIVGFWHDDTEVAKSSAS